MAVYYDKKFTLGCSMHELLICAVTLKMYVNNYWPVLNSNM